jgi:hypothetical protein
MNDIKPQPKTTAASTQTEKRPYIAPQLTVHGTVSELTAFTSGANTDQQGGSGPG